MLSLPAGPVMHVVFACVRVRGVTGAGPCLVRGQGVWVLAGLPVPPAGDM